MTRLTRALVALLLALGGTTAHARDSEPATVCSPDERLCFTIETVGEIPHYSVTRDGQAVIARSRLGFMLRDEGGKFEHAILLGAPVRREVSERWEQPWGENHWVDDRHREMRVAMTELIGAKRRIDLVARAFDTGVGFRFEFPDQPQLTDIRIDEELTEFNVAGEAEAWWIPAGEWNRYEYLYNHTPAREVGTAHSPLTLRRADGLHIAIHEAALSDYSGFWLQRLDGQRFRTRLAPSSQPWKVEATAPFATPWRTIQIAEDAPALYASSDLVLNLNEPNRLGDVSWVKPKKYVGIWWAMHLDQATWESGPRHGATTANATSMIDFAADHGFDAVLIEGWNVGWNGNWIGDHGRDFQFDQAYPDFDIAAVAAHARGRGVELMGHHETAGNADRYEEQMASAYALYQRLGVHAVKTGYVADAGGVLRQDSDGQPVWEWHDGQFMARHHVRVAREAARHQLAVDAHEPIKDTGLRRTYPNLVSREGARGMEYAAWGEPPNPPEHEATLLFTRLLSGPMDYTPGIVSLTGKAGRRIPSTLAKQLANYVVLYSPVQMAADLPENYLASPEAFAFIKAVPVDWERTLVLDGAVGEHAVVARQRRDGADWWVGGVTGGSTHDQLVDLGFLEAGRRYTAELYRDGPGGGIGGNPFAMTVEHRTVTSADRLTVRMEAGGGFALSLTPAD